MLKFFHFIFLSFLFLRQGLTLLPRLESGGAIMGQCSLNFLDSGDPPTLASQVAETTGTHHTSPVYFRMDPHPEKLFHELPCKFAVLTILYGDQRNCT